jgi:glycosyltransferase involved in cell wall biosynthesis
MRIGIDASTWHNNRGFGRFTRELVAAMLACPGPHQFVLLSDSPIAGVPPAEQILVSQSRQVIDAAVDGSRRSVADLLRFSLAAHRARLQLLFYPAVYSWFPCPPGLCNVVTLHDAIAERFPRMVFPNRLSRLAWRAKVRISCAQATRLLTVSAAARREIVEHMHIREHRIDLTTEGPRDIFVPLSTAAMPRMQAELAARFSFGPTDALLAYVGGFAPHKNVATLLRAFARLPESLQSRTTLLLVCDPAGAGFHSNLGELHALIAAHPALANATRFTGFVDDNTLASIYSVATALVMPSFSEGFGLPAIEAMACGTPVIASSAGALPEVVGDSGMIVNPCDEVTLVKAMEKMLVDRTLRAALAQKALTRSAQFSWKRGAELALNCIERCWAERQR